MRGSIASAQWPSGRNSFRICQLCKLAAIQRPTLYQCTAKSTFATLGAGLPRAKHPRETSERALLLLRPTLPFPRYYRFGPPKASKPSVSPKAQTGRVEANASPFPGTGSAPLVDTSATITAVDHAKDELFARDGIPSEQNVLSTLAVCNRAASLPTTTSIGHTSGKPDESDTAASSLLSLDGSVTELTKPMTTAVLDALRPRDLIDHISQVTFEIISHSSIVITPQVLDAYIDIQARLGRPETLPYVFGLYASKPKPRGNRSPQEYDQQNPNRAAKAVDPETIEKALDIAIEAKNLDAAIGIIESTYATKAFVRQKLLRKALFPMTAAAAAPLAVYVLASNLAQLQSSYDQKTATAVATAGFLAYVGFTGSMGLLAVLTQNDQMKRVTWAPGVTLRERWMREEERAALDKVACSFGFSQTQRYGEEEGAEFQTLRRFILTKGMILDKIELMEGMS